MNETTPAMQATSGAAAADPGQGYAAALMALAARQGLLLAVKDVPEGRYLSGNAGFAAFVGRSLAELVGRTDADLLEPPLAQAMRVADQTALAHGAPLASDHRFEWRGSKFDFSVLRVRTMLDDKPVLMCIWQDMTTQRQRDQQLRTALEQLEREQHAQESLRRELADQGLRDGATGLYTRAHFEDQLRREVDLSTREHREFAMVFAELDPFDDRVKAAGARGEGRILDAMGRLLRGNTRAMDASCRFDERRFAILLSGVGLATAHARMEGLRRQCATQIVVLDGQELGFTVSMGVASFPHTAHSQQEIHAACEAALAEARRRGGNTVALASIRFESV
jgi:diguanylate cyclase (GGDEF)-like protein